MLQKDHPRMKPMHGQIYLPTLSPYLGSFCPSLVRVSILT